MTDTSFLVAILYVIVINILGWGMTTLFGVAH